MFTGIVEAMGTVGDIAGRDVTLRLLVEAPGIAAGVGLGASVAVNGACLTVVGIDHGVLAFDIGPETVQATTLGDLQRGDQVNLERPLRFDGVLGGHLVLGHVDSVGSVLGLTRLGATARMRIGLPNGDLSPLLIPKGSVAVDGVSLTVAALEDLAFEVMIIPHTLAVTTLGRVVPGSRVNLEMDVIGKYLQRSLSLGYGPGSGGHDGPRGPASPERPGAAWGAASADRPQDARAASSDTPRDLSGAGSSDRARDLWGRAPRDGPELKGAGS
jgi:riboflavin synthase alpha subunit